MYTYTCRLKQPEYQHYRETIGAAKAFEQFEEITAEIKALLLVCSTHGTSYSI